MIVEIGHYALVLALVLTLFQATFPLWGAIRRDAALVALGPLVRTSSRAASPPGAAQGPPAAGIGLAEMPG